MPITKAISIDGLVQKQVDAFSFLARYCSAFAVLIWLYVFVSCIVSCFLSVFYPYLYLYLYLYIVVICMFINACICISSLASQPASVDISSHQLRHGSGILTSIIDEPEGLHIVYIVSPIQSSTCLGCPPLTNPEESHNHRVWTRAGLPAYCYCQVPEENTVTLRCFSEL